MSSRQSIDEKFEVGVSSRSGDGNDGQISLSMLGWAYNEEENISRYIERAGHFLADLTNDFELILIDDGSEDKTLSIAIECQKTRPWLRVFRNDRNPGPGFNTKRAISLSSKDYLFWQTVDWSYDIEGLKKALPLLKSCDVLQGVRYETLSFRGVIDRRSDTFYKGVVSLFNYLLIRVLFQLPLGDFQNVTVYPTRFVQSFTLETESSFTNPECLLKAWWKGATFRQFHAPFVKRRYGRGSGSTPQAIVSAVTDIWQWWFRWIVLGKRTDKGRGRVL